MNKMVMSKKDGKAQEGQNHSEQENTFGDKGQNKQSGNEENSENQGNESKGNDGQENEQGENGDSEERFMDDHSMWEKAFQDRDTGTKRESKTNTDSQKSQSADNKPSEQTSDEITFEFDERSEFEQNREEQLERFGKKSDKTNRKIRGKQATEEPIDLGSIGESRNEIDWKLLLRREVEKSETIWSQRRSVAENNYAYRLEENDAPEEAETEVMIDV